VAKKYVHRFASRRTKGGRLRDVVSQIIYRELALHGTSHSTTIFPAREIAHCCACTVSCTNARQIRRMIRLTSLTCASTWSFSPSHLLIPVPVDFVSHPSSTLTSNIYTHLIIYTMRLPTLSLVALLPYLASVLASDVYDLTASTFKSEVMGADLALVEFFAPCM
jgi:hypothetical protein